MKTLRVKHGLYSNMPTLSPSEFGHANDTTNNKDRLFIGSLASRGNIEILTSQSDIEGKVTKGYLYNGAFYSDSAHTTSVTPSADQLYVDLTTGATSPTLYFYNGTTFAALSTSGGGSGGGSSTTDIVDHFLGFWDATQGLPESTPSHTTYEDGDCYIVSVISTANTSDNKMPSGSSYTGTASTELPIDPMTIGTVYYYKGNGTWGTLGGTNVTDVIVGNYSSSGMGPNGGKVSYVPIATPGSSYGVIKVDETYGVTSFHDESNPTAETEGVLYIKEATDSEITAKNNSYKPITPAHIHKVIEEGLGNYAGTAFTDAKKTKARETIGASNVSLLETTTDTVSSQYQYMKVDDTVVPLGGTGAGANVIANPTTSSTAALTKLSVDGTVYRLEAPALVYNDFESMIEAFNSMDAGIHPIGMDVFIQTKGVSDCWIMSNNESTSYPYLYVDDDDFNVQLGVEGGVQVGYYKFGTLEAMTDISNVVKNTDYASTSTAGIVKASSEYGFSVGSEGAAKAITSSAEVFAGTGINDDAFVSKGTLNNILHNGGTSLDSPMITNKHYILDSKSDTFNMVLPTPSASGYFDVLMVEFDVASGATAFTPTVSGGATSGIAIPSCTAGKHYTFTWLLKVYQGTPKWCFDYVAE